MKMFSPQNEIRKKVELMSGVFLKSFTEKTTHIVVNSVVSTKYEVCSFFLFIHLSVIHCCTSFYLIVLLFLLICFAESS